MINRRNIFTGFFASLPFIAKAKEVEPPKIKGKVNFVIYDEHGKILTEWNITHDRYVERQDVWKVTATRAYQDAFLKLNNYRDFKFNE